MYQATLNDRSIFWSARGYDRTEVSRQTGKALKILDDLLVRSQKNYVSPAHIASIYAGLGEKDRAFAWLEKAYEMRSRSLAWLNVAHEWDNLRSDLRFTDLLRKVGLAT